MFLYQFNVNTDKKDRMHLENILSNNVHNNITSLSSKLSFQQPLYNYVGMLLSLSPLSCLIGLT